MTAPRVDAAINVLSYIEHTREVRYQFSLLCWTLCFVGICRSESHMLTHSAVLKNAFHPAALLDQPTKLKPASERQADEESLDRWMQLIGGVSYYPRRVQIIH